MQLQLIRVVPLRATLLMFTSQVLPNASVGDDVILQLRLLNKFKAALVRAAFLVKKGHFSSLIVYLAKFYLI